MPVSSRRAAAAIAALVVGRFAIGTTEFVTMGLLPQIAEGIGTDIPTTGHTISAYALGVVVGAPLIAVRFARYPRKGLLMALMGLFTIGNAASALAPGYATMLGARFVTGLPHGAFFGLAALVAASLVKPAHRGRAVGRIMLGIPAANVLGVPATTWLGQVAGWRTTYAVIALLGLLTAALVALAVPRRSGDATATGRRELRALRNPALWLSMLAGALGFGGMFAMYSYIAPTVTQVTGQPGSSVPLFLLVYGLGGLVGAELAGRVAERSVFGGVVAGFALMALVLATFWLTSQWLVPALLTLACSAVVASLLVVNLQLQLMHDAGPAETLGAALNHSALNIANALGAWVGGLVIAAGHGYRAPSLAGAALALVGLACLAVYRVVETRRREEDSQEAVGAAT